MNSFQESKNELEAAIRYAENAISSAQATIESMEFRQEMAKKSYQEQTGREEALTKQVQELEERNDELNIQIVEQTNREATLERDLTAKTAQANAWKKEVEKLRSEKEASSGPCGCQAYRDLEEARGRAEGEVELLQRTIADLEAQVNALEQPEQPTMPVIPKAVAIAIFREGVQHGVEAACTELDDAQFIRIEESEYVGDFHVTFERDLDLNDHIDTDWMRDKCGDYSEESVIDALSTLCADNEFECRIHGVDEPEAKTNA